MLASLLCPQGTTFTYVSIFSRHFLSRSPFSLAVPMWWSVQSDGCSLVLYDLPIVAAGASGGVYSLIAAHLATMALNWQEDSSVRIQKASTFYDYNSRA